MTLKDFSKRPCGKKFFQTLIMRGNGPQFGISQGHKLVRPFKGIILYPTLLGQWSQQHTLYP
jgi:hypothetical protein